LTAAGGLPCFAVTVKFWRKTRFLGLKFEKSSNYKKNDDATVNISLLKKRGIFFLNLKIVGLKLLGL